MEQTNTTNVDIQNDDNVYLTDSEDKYLLDKEGIYLTTIDKKENNNMANTKKYVSLDKLGLYDGKIKGVISAGDAEALESAKAYADGLATNYDAAGSAASAETNAKSYTDTEVAKANTAAAEAKAQADKGVTDAATAQAAAEAAQGDVDALEAYVGTFTASEGVDTVVKYIDAKTANIASDERVNGIDTRVTAVEGDVDTIKGDYLKKADKEELAGDIAGVQAAVDAEAARADAAEKVNAAAIKVITDDYLKAADKEELQNNIDAVSGAVELLTNGVDADKVDGVNDLIKYVEDHGAEFTGIQEDVAKNAEAISGVAGRMDTAEGKIATLEGDVAKKVDKTAYDEKIAALEDADSALSDRIDELFGEGEGTVGDMISDAIDAERALIDAELAKKVDKVDGKGLSTNDLTNELKGQYDAAYTHSQEAHAPANAQANVIESVKVNGSALTITDKAVDITVPTDNAELTNGAGYLVANDIANKADKGTTLAAYGISDAYTSAQTDIAIANAVGQFVECSEEDINGLFA